jgi:hypothetical protein
MFRDEGTGSKALDVLIRSRCGRQVVLLIRNGLRSVSAAIVAAQRKLENDLSTFSVRGASGTKIRGLSATAMSTFRLYGPPKYCKV